MKQDIKPAWLDMSLRSLASQLSDERYPTPIIKGIIAKVKVLKSERRAERIKATVLYKMWDEVLQPARTELATVRTMKSQLKSATNMDFMDADAQARADALWAYDAVIAGVIEELREFQRRDQLTPEKAAKRLHKAGVMRPEHTGSHWTHYVSAEDTHRIKVLFDRMPHPRRGKKKEPFPYRISPAAHARQRAMIVGSLAKAQANAEQEYDMATNSFDRERLEKVLADIHEAQYKLDAIPDTLPVPSTWQKLLTLSLD